MVPARVIKRWPTGEADLLIETDADASGRIVFTAQPSELAEWSKSEAKP